MPVKIATLKKKLQDGELRRQKTATLHKLVLIHADELRAENISASDLTYLLELSPSYMAEVNKMFKLNDELKAEGYAIVKA